MPGNWKRLWRAITPPKDIKAPQCYLRIFRDEVDMTGVGGYYYSNGKTLASGSTYGTIILWDVDVQSWLRRACRRANRNLTIAEWRQYLGDLPYQKNCLDLPVPEDAKAAASPPVQEN